MRPIPALLVLAACAGGCARRAPSPTVDDDGRDRARLVLEEHCGECHIGGSDTAITAALRVFDLTEPDFTARMSDAQLANALWRLGEPLDEHARPRVVTTADRALVASFIALERARRARATRR